MAAVFTAAVEVDSMGAAASTAAERFAVLAGSVEAIAAAASGVPDLTVEAPTEAAPSWAAGASRHVDPADSGAASMLQAADTQAAADTALAMRSRTATGTLLVVLEPP